MGFSRKGMDRKKGHPSTIPQQRMMQIPYTAKVHDMLFQFRETVEHSVIVSFDQFWSV